jgi:protocatechuate 3,4-dioxygenase beta subunit
MYSKGHGLALAFAALATLPGWSAAAPRSMSPVVTESPAQPQPPPAQPRRPDPVTSTASIRGTVISGTDRAPLARARVTASSRSLAAPRVTLSAPDGSFAFERLPPGTYALTVTRTGYARAQYGERQAASAVPIAIQPGQAVTGIEVALEPAGIIVGQILDEDGQPLAGASVEALAPRMVDRRETFVVIASAQTDDRGEFRMPGVPAGPVYVSAFDPAFAHVGDEGGALEYTRTYYPGVAVPSQAKAVTAAPGDAPRIAFKLRINRLPRVGGVLRTADGRELGSAAVMMRAAAEGTPARTPDVTILPDGSFTFRNVPPGDYQIRARGDVNNGELSLFSTYRVHVEDRDIGNIDMLLVPGARIEGRVVAEGHRPEKRPVALAGVRVRAPFADGSTFGDAVAGEVQPDGTFAIGGVMAGSHAIALEGLASPWVLQAVTWRGRDLTDTGLATESRQVYADVVITVTDAASEVAGVVRDSRGTPVEGATIVFVPAPPQPWTRASRRLRVIRADASGRYSVRGLPPGDYRAAAAMGLDDAEAYRPENLEEIARTGLPVAVKDLAPMGVDLRIASTPRPRQPR